MVNDRNNLGNWKSNEWNYKNNRKNWISIEYGGKIIYKIDVFSKYYMNLKKKFKFLIRKLIRIIIWNFKWIRIIIILIINFSRENDNLKLKFIHIR